MALAVASLIAKGETTIYNAHVTADSFPDFESTLRALNVDVQVCPQPTPSPAHLAAGE